MADTYTQAYFHLVFACKFRTAFVNKSWKDELEKYITGIVKNNGHKLIAISAMPDHIHIFIGYNLSQTIPSLVENIKTSSNKWINEKRHTKSKFYWQNGYGAFTHSHAQISVVSDYIANQEAHHNKKTFKEEYSGMLKEFQVEYKDEYLFTFFEDQSVNN